MRLQLAQPEQHASSARIATTRSSRLHGTTMMFLFAVPMMEGMGDLSRAADGRHAQRRVSATECLRLLDVSCRADSSYTGGVFTNTAPDAGWFAYPPLSGPQFSPGKRVDFWAQMITFTEVSAMCVAVELIATIFKMRAPGMSLNRIPMFCWSMLVQSFMVIFAMPAVMIASTFSADRPHGRHALRQSGRGRRSASLPARVLVFWTPGGLHHLHAGAGIRFVHSWMRTSRRQIFGYPALVLSLVGNGFIAFGLWVHHMFATGLPQIGEAYFTAASMMIAITSGVQIFCWLATLWSGRLRMTTPLHFVFGFISIFVMGGMTGVMLASFRSICRCTTRSSSSRIFITC